MPETCRTHVSYVFLRICYVFACRVHFNVVVSVQHRFHITLEKSLVYNSFYKLELIIVSNFERGTMVNKTWGVALPLPPFPLVFSSCFFYLLTMISAQLTQSS